LFVEVALIVEGQAFAERSLLRDRVVGWRVHPVANRRLTVVRAGSGVQRQHRRGDLGNSPDREGVRYCRAAVQVGFLGVSRRSCNGDIPNLIGDIPNSRCLISGRYRITKLN
jgi:hypothetical protein